MIAMARARSLKSRAVSPFFSLRYKSLSASLPSTQANSPAHSQSRSSGPPHCSRRCSQSGTAISSVSASNVSFIAPTRKRSARTEPCIAAGRTIARRPPAVPAHRSSGAGPRPPKAFGRALSPAAGCSGAWDRRDTAPGWTAGPATCTQGRSESDPVVAACTGHSLRDTRRASAAGPSPADRAARRTRHDTPCSSSAARPHAPG